MNPATVFLVVDDYDPMRKVTVNQLRSMGVQQVFTAANGAEALRILRTQRVDIVLSDWNMPVMTGIELFRAICSDPYLYELPFILITAEAERRQIHEAIAAGVTDLIVKPYSPRRLASQIDKALTSTRRRLRSAADEPDVHDLSSRKPLGASRPEESPLLLMVDDEPDNLSLLSELFKDDYRLRLAQNGARALAICQGDSPPDLVLLDVMMPGMDGFEVMRQLRDHPTSENIPVIFVTARDADADRALGLELGAVDYVTKPIDPPTLQLRVRNFMRFVNLRRQLQASFDDMIELDQLRSQVEHMARHDVKGPIAAALGILNQVVDEGCEHENDLKLAIQALQTAVQTVSLSSDLLKIESGTYVLQPEPVAILDQIQEVIDTHRPLWLDRHLTHRVEPEADTSLEPVAPPILGEAALCRVILQNLLKNAWEASPLHGEVVLSWKAENGQWSVRLTNRGAVLIPIRPRFFDKYITAGKAQGTGLGTYSAQLLARVQQGSLMLEVDDQRDTTTLVWSMPLA